MATPSRMCAVLIPSSSALFLQALRSVETSLPSTIFTDEGIASKSCMFMRCGLRRTDVFSSVFSCEIISLYSKTSNGTSESSFSVNLLLGVKSFTQSGPMSRCARKTGVSSMSLPLRFRVHAISSREETRDHCAPFSRAPFLILSTLD